MVFLCGIGGAGASAEALQLTAGSRRPDGVAASTLDSKNSNVKRKTKDVSCWPQCYIMQFRMQFRILSQTVFETWQLLGHSWNPVDLRREVGQYCGLHVAESIYIYIYIYIYIWTKMDTPSMRMHSIPYGDPLSTERLWPQWFVPASWILGLPWSELRQDPECEPRSLVPSYDRSGIE